MKRYSLALLGLILFSSGLCVFGEALIKKINKENYFWLGTLSLVIFNSGICIFGQSIIVKMKSKT